MGKFKLDGFKINKINKIFSVNCINYYTGLSHEQKKIIPNTF